MRFGARLHAPAAALRSHLCACATAPASPCCTYFQLTGHVYVALSKDQQESSRLGMPQGPQSTRKTRPRSKSLRILRRLGMQFFAQTRNFLPSEPRAYVGSLFAGFEHFGQKGGGPSVGATM